MGNPRARTISATGSEPGRRAQRQLRDLVEILPAASRRRRFSIVGLRRIRISGQSRAARPRHPRPRRAARAGMGAALRLCRERAAFVVANRQGLRRKFETRALPPLRLRKESRPNTWAPLLLLNGTSVNSGRRIVVSDLVSTRPNEDGSSRVALYSAAFDFFEMTSTGCLVDSREREPKCPEVSSAANDIPTLRDGRRHSVVERGAHERSIPNFVSGRRHTRQG